MSFKLLKNFKKYLDKFFSINYNNIYKSILKVMEHKYAKIPL